MPEVSLTWLQSLDKSTMVLIASPDHAAYLLLLLYLRHVKGTQVVFWILCDQAWLILSLLAVAASVEHVEGVSKALRWRSGYFVLKYDSV